MHPPKGDHPRVGRWFWLWWLLATAGGAAVGAAITFVALAHVLDQLHQAAYGLVIGTVFGAVIGTAQWLVLRSHLDRSGWWVLLTLIGWVVFWELNLLNLLGAAAGIAFIPDILHLGLFGGLVGSLQWVLLRGRVRGAGWWVLASVLAGMFGALVADGVNAALHRDIPLDFLTGSMVGGVVNGVTMMWLLQRPALPKNRAG
jgi:hypothetical protein